MKKYLEEYSVVIMFFLIMIISVFVISSKVNKTNLSYAENYKITNN